MNKDDYENTLCALTEFKFKAKSLHINAIVEVIYDDYQENPKEFCDVDLGREGVITIGWENAVNERNFYPSYDTRYIKMSLCNETLTLECIDRNNMNIQIKITLNDD